ncbi:DegQ family serine endoprotease [Chlamydiota bacterium]
MMNIKNILILSLSTALLSTAGLAQDIPVSNEALLKQISKGFSNVAKAATPAVVYIETQSTEQTQGISTRKGSSENPFDYFNDDFFNRFFGYPFDKKQPKSSSPTVRGSGFLISKDGYIVTNFHVVENANKVSVTLQNGQKMVATVVGTDPKTDLAVIKIAGNDYTFLNFGDSDALEVGDWAIAIGNPFGLQTSVTVGVVSAKGRNHLNIADFEDFIQTDAAINPGNSGGPLLNVEAEVIGVNTAIVSGSGGYMGIGFAIPSNMAKQIVAQLIKEGQVTRGFLGVTLQPIDSDLASFYKLKNVQGALVTDVVKGSPADLGGLKQEDIILSYNGNTVDSLSGFRNHVSLMQPGAKLKLKVFRDGKEMELNLTVAQLPNETAGPNLPAQKLGIQVQELTPELSQKLDLEDAKGVVITQVTPGSPAALSALKPGNLIMAVNRQKVANMAEFSAALSEAAKEGRVLLMIRQGDAIRIVALHF